MQTTLEDWVEEYRDDPEFVAEGLAIDVIEDALTILEERGKRQSWLAQAMGVSRQSVSRMFNATPNLTLLSIARIAVALGVEPRVILDSGRYRIQSVDEPIPDYEDLMTEVAYRRTQYTGPNALDTSLGSISGVPDNAAT